LILRTAVIARRVDANTAAIDGIKIQYFRKSFKIFAILLITAIVMARPAFPAECVIVKYRDTPVCLTTFICAETPQSSFVREICYDQAKSYMLIKLNETWYHYCSVDLASVDNLVHASSVGRYYNQHFRSQGSVHGSFDCRDHPVPNYQ
jgi:hypothetical protein